MLKAQYLVHILRLVFDVDVDFIIRMLYKGWLGTRVVSVLDSGTEGPGSKIAMATLSGNSLRQTAHTHCASVHQAEKLVAALSTLKGCGG